MTNTFRRAALATFAMATLATTALPQSARAGNRDFTMVNNMPFVAASVFIRPAGTQAWSNDILGNTIIEPGQRAILRVGEGPQCIFDVRVLAVRPGHLGVYNFERINLCRLDVMTTSYDGTPRAELRNVN